MTHVQAPPYIPTRSVDVVQEQSSYTAGAGT